MTITNKTVDKYIEYLYHAFAFYKVRRYDIKGEKLLSTQNKYYLADHSFRYALLGAHNMDIQVSDDIAREETLKREVEPLLDAFPKIIIARTKHDTYEYEGIKIINIASWLLDK